MKLCICGEALRDGEVMCPLCHVDMEAVSHLLNETGRVAALPHPYDGPMGIFTDYNGSGSEDR